MKFVSVWQHILQYEYDTVANNQYWSVFQLIYLQA